MPSITPSKIIENFAKITSVMAMVDRFREALQRSNDAIDQEYTPLTEDDDDAQDDPCRLSTDRLPHTHSSAQTLSTFEYLVFLFLGIAMLWAWNMYLAATPYFARRFAHSTWISNNYQSSIILCGTLTNLLSMLALAKLQAGAFYMQRVIAALCINMVVFTLLAISTVVMKGMNEAVYLIWVLASVFLTSIATGLLQNGAFALAAGSGQSVYTQAIMTGQAIAGVLPPIAQILSVFTVPVQKSSSPKNMQDPNKTGNSALVYFLTATAISGLTLLLVIPLFIKRNVQNDLKTRELNTALELDLKKTVTLTTLFSKLRWLAAAVFICFATTMFFPVFTARISSTQLEDGRYWLFDTATFVPLAFLFWNVGDLSGRLTAATLPSIISNKPQFLIFASTIRIAFVSLYYLCNIAGRGAVVGANNAWGDAFYLLVVQFGFGLTNGWIGSLCMMGAAKWVHEGEEEAAGGFMGLMLVSGLAVGSLMSFVV